MTEPLAAQSSHSLAKRCHVIAHDMSAEVPIRSCPIAGLADLFARIDDDSDGESMPPLGNVDQLLAIFRAHIGGVHDREPASLQAQFQKRLEKSEGVRRRRLTVLVVRDERAAHVGRDDLCRLEMLAREGGLARARGSDQQNDGEFRHRDPRHGRR